MRRWSCGTTRAGRRSPPASSSSPARPGRSRSSRSASPCAPACTCTRGDWRKRPRSSTKRGRSWRRPGSASRRYSALVLATMRGAEDEAAALMAATREDVVRRGEGLGLAVVHWTSALLGNSLGRYAEALTAAERGCEFPSELPFSQWSLVELIEAGVRSGRPERAVPRLEALSERTRASGTDWALGVEARSRALLADDDVAEPLYREAIDRLGRTSMGVEHARAHLVYGEWLRRERRRVDAREQLRAAHEQFTTMGLEAFARRAARELLATGATARKRTVETRGDLTAQEAPDRAARARRAVQSRDRRPPLHQPPHGPVPPPQGLRQARHHLPQPAPPRPSRPTGRARATALSARSPGRPQRVPARWSVRYVASRSPITPSGGHHGEPAPLTSALVIAAIAAAAATACSSGEATVLDGVGDAVAGGPYALEAGDRAVVADGDEALVIGGDAVEPRARASAGARRHGRPRAFGRSAAGARVVRCPRCNSAAMPASTRMPARSSARAAARPAPGPNAASGRGSLVTSVISMSCLHPVGVAAEQQRQLVGRQRPHGTRRHDERHAAGVALLDVAHEPRQRIGIRVVPGRGARDTPGASRRRRRAAGRRRGGSRRASTRRRADASTPVTRARRNRTPAWPRDVMQRETIRRVPCRTARRPPACGGRTRPGRRRASRRAPRRRARRASTPPSRPATPPPATTTRRRSME